MLSRISEDELMDDPALAEDQHIAALRSLSRLNAFSNSAQLLWNEIKKSAGRNAGEKIRVLDIATGGGDLPIRLLQFASDENINLEISGVDKSPTALAFAHKLAAGQPGLKFEQLDIFADELPRDYDVIMCSLFIHHLDPEEAIALFQKMGRAARKLVLVNDLVRSRWTLGIVWLGSRLLSNSPVVRFDSTASVR
ncbi:MAG: methyltransferase domain-containing protein, partial [Terriglobales bacterium]